MSRFKATRILSLILVLSLFVSIMAPAALALEVESKWKFMLLEDSAQQVLSESNFEEQTAAYYYPMLPYLKEYYELSFSIQKTQPLRLEVYALADGVNMEDVSLASGGQANLDEFDPRGEFKGYLYGTYEGNLRAYDGTDLDTAETFIGFDGGDPSEWFEPMSLMGTNSVDFDYNIVYWMGLIVEAADPRVSGFSLPFSPEDEVVPSEEPDAVGEPEETAEPVETDTPDPDPNDTDVPEVSPEPVDENDNGDVLEPDADPSVLFSLLTDDAIADPEGDTEEPDDTSDTPEPVIDGDDTDDSDTVNSDPVDEPVEPEEPEIEITALASDTPILLGEYDDETGDLIPGAYDYVVVLQPLSQNTHEYLSFLPVRVDYTDIPDDWGFNKDDPYNICDWNGDPVDMVSGNFMWEYTDIAMYGAEELAFSRTYNSRDSYNGPLGTGWRHSYDYSIEEYNLFSIVTMANGFKMSFKLNFDGSFTPPSGVRFDLEQTGSGFLLTGWDKTEYSFNSDGQITSIDYADGSSVAFSYSGDNLSSVSNNTGTLTFGYSGDKITSVSDQTGRSIALSYSGDTLSSVTNTDGDTLNYTYSGGYLTGINDFKGNTYLQNRYDDKGRVIEQYLADEGTSHFTFDSEARISTYTAPSGEVTTYKYNTEGNV